jgi:hypothetical protein
MLPVEDERKRSRAADPPHTRPHRVKVSRTRRDFTL